MTLHERVEPVLVKLWKPSSNVWILRFTSYLSHCLEILFEVRKDKSERYAIPFFCYSLLLPFLLFN